MRVIVDAFGGDNAPFGSFKRCRLAKDEFDVSIILAGNEVKIKDISEKENIDIRDMSIINAENQMQMEDEPTSIRTTNKNSSLAVGLRALRDDMGDVFVSAGSTGGLIVGATLIVGRLKGVKRAPIATILPTQIDKKPVLLLDSGANVECKAEHLVEFAALGSAYVKTAFNLQNPKIALLNNGTEDHKGGEMRTKVYSLLKASPMNFIGNVEGRDCLSGEADVIVTDGFTGNIVLKLVEGVSGFLFSSIKNIFKTSFISKMAALLIKKQLKGLKKKLDYSEYGGAPILGLSKPVIKAHGSSNANAIKNAIRQALALNSEKINNDIVQTLDKLKTEEN